MVNLWLGEEMGVRLGRVVEKARGKDKMGISSIGLRLLGRNDGIDHGDDRIQVLIRVLS